MAVNQKRVNEVVERIFNYNDQGVLSSRTITGRVLSVLPEFQTPEWIKLSEREPATDQPIFWCRAGDKTVMLGMYSKFGYACGREIYWMPREVPVPPIEEDSELVKRVKNIGVCTPGALNEVVKVIEQWEREQKK